MIKKILILFLQQRIISLIAGSFVLFIASPAIGVRLSYAGVSVQMSSVAENNDPQKGEIKTQKFVLDNGLTVLISEMPGSQTVSVFAFVKTGSATEGKYTGTGISHFMEHMLFKGTDKRGVGQISKEVQALGGEINASTSFDETMYTISLPAGAFEQGLDIISDMLTHSRFDPKQIDKEREVVYGEMRLYKDNPERFLSQMVFKSVYKQHPYGIPVIGYEDLLRALTRDDFVDYYKTRYIPDNIILSVAGKVQVAEILPKIRAAFKDFSRKPVILRNLPPEPAQINERLNVDYYPTDLTRVSMAYAGVSARDRDLYAMDALSMLLGQGESSRLFKDIYMDKKLVRSIGSSDYTPMDRGIFEIEMLLDDKNLEPAIKAVKDQISLIGQKGPETSELEKIKRQIASRHIFGRLTSDGVAENSAFDEAYYGDANFSKEYVGAIKNITSEDIKRVAKKYLLDSCLSLNILKPAKLAAQVNAIQTNAENIDIQKIVLDNGLTVLLRENHASPTVSISLVLNGGTWEENTDNNGISLLTAQLLTSGTRTRKVEDIARSIESRGLSLSPYSGRNSLGLSMGFLSDDTDFAIDLLEDVVKNSTFPEGEILRQKQDILTALISQEDNINTVTSRNLRETLFEKHPFRFDSLGTAQSISKLTRAQIIDFYQKYAVPNNMVLSVYGDIQPNSILSKIKKKFGVLIRKEINLTSLTEDPPRETREKTIHLNKKQAVVMIGFQGAGLKSPDRHAVEVMTDILGSAFSGRIFNTVRDEFGQAYTLGGGYSPYRGVGMISFFVQTTDDNVLKVKDLLLRLISDLQKNPVSEEELTNMKTYLKGSQKMALQLDSSLGFTNALDELYGNGYNNYKSFDTFIDAVTPADIQRLAREYLDFRKAAVIIARPTPEALANPDIKFPRIPTQAPGDIH